MDSVADKIIMLFGISGHILFGMLRRPLWPLRLPHRKPNGIMQSPSLVLSPPFAMKTNITFSVRSAAVAAVAAGLHARASAEHSALRLCVLFLARALARCL